MNSALFRSISAALLMFAVPACLGSTPAGGDPSSPGGGMQPGGNSDGPTGGGGSGGTVTGGGAGSTGGQAGQSGQPDGGGPTPGGDMAMGGGGTTLPQQPPLTECTTASLDRLQQWIASGEGSTTPASGSTLVKSGSVYSAHVVYNGGGWHVAPVVWLQNIFDAQVDLTKSKGFTVTYAASAQLYMQFRPAVEWSGGNKWLVTLPATGGQKVTKSFSFAAADWGTKAELGVPPYTLASVLNEARGFVFVGDTANTIDLYDLRIDGFSPPCK